MTDLNSIQLDQEIEGDIGKIAQKRDQCPLGPGWPPKRYRGYGYDASE